MKPKEIKFKARRIGDHIMFPDDEGDVYTIPISQLVLAEGFCGNCDNRIWANGHFITADTYLQIIKLLRNKKK